MGADYKDCVERKHMDGKQEYLQEKQKRFLPAGDKGWTESEKYSKISDRYIIIKHFYLLMTVELYEQCRWINTYCTLYRR